MVRGAAKGPETEYKCIPVGVASTTPSGKITSVVAVVETSLPPEIGIVQVSHMQIKKGQKLMLPDIKPCTDFHGETGEGCTLCYREADDDMVVCDECGFWQHIDCQERWGLYFERICGRDICCYCHNSWPEVDDGTGYYKIASEQS